MIEEYKKQLTERMENGGYLFVLNFYVNTVFQDFEIYLRTEIDLVEDDIRLVLEEYN